MYRDASLLCLLLFCDDPFIHSSLFHHPHHPLHVISRKKKKKKMEQKEKRWWKERDDEKRGDRGIPGAHVYLSDKKRWHNDKKMSRRRKGDSNDRTDIDICFSFFASSLEGISHSLFLLSAWKIFRLLMVTSGGIERQDEVGRDTQENMCELLITSLFSFCCLLMSSIFFIWCIVLLKPLKESSSWCLQIFFRLSFFLPHIRCSKYMHVRNDNFRILLRLDFG